MTQISYREKYGLRLKRNLSKKKEYMKNKNLLPIDFYSQLLKGLIHIDTLLIHKRFKIFSFTGKINNEPLICII